MKHDRAIPSVLAVLSVIHGHDREIEGRIAGEVLNFDVGQKLYDLRNAHGLTQQQLAKLVGTTQSVIARIEDNDYSGHTLKMLSRVAHALGYTVEVNFIKKKLKPQRAVAAASPSKRRIAARSIAKPSTRKRKQ